jgi:hypothetical protein
LVTLFMLLETVFSNTGVLQSSHRNYRPVAVEGFAQKVEIDAARRILTVDTESQPAVAGDSIKPGVERSGTPG